MNYQEKIAKVEEAYELVLSGSSFTHIKERLSVSGIYQYGAEAYLDIADILGIDSFTIDSNQILFKCFKHIYYWWA